MCDVALAARAHAPCDEKSGCTLQTAAINAEEEARHIVEAAHRPHRAAPATRISSWIFSSEAIRERSIGLFGQIGVQNATTEYRVRMTLCGGTLQPSALSY